ncbi:MAG: hypothetical protein WCR17_00705 [Candidatus Methanomethylophilaceae archaeon]|jgi:hypothetical protein
MFASSKKTVKDPKYLLNEGPTVIGMMSVVIDSGGSLDTAVRNVSRDGPRGARPLFKSVVYDADTRQIPDIKAGLTSAISSLPESLSAFRRSLHMVIAASESNDANERARMLKDASDISIAGLKETGETYSSSLNTPCMVVFALGIMVPMVLMSILPMLNIGGMFGGTPIDSNLVSILTLAGIPAVIVTTILGVKEKNPFMLPVSGSFDIKYIIPFVIAIPAAFAIYSYTGKVDTAVIISTSVSGLLVFASMYPEVRKEKLRAKQERYLKDSVFELGNRLISGENFETALVSAIAVRSECASLAESMKRELMMSRGDNCAAIRTAIGNISPFVADLLCDICRCSVKDIRDAGRLAISVGRQLQDQETVRKSIGNKLKSMVDMMTGTAMVFAPLVLGMSVSMLGPLTEIMDGADMSGTSITLSVYLAELCILISFLTAYLNGKPEPKEIVYRIGMMLPVAMMVFLVCTRISF